VPEDLRARPVLSQVLPGTVHLHQISATTEAYLVDANSGIGLETAILFARNGGSVILADLNDEGLETAKGKIETLIPGAKFKIFVYPSLFLECLP